MGQIDESVRPHTKRDLHKTITSWTVLSIFEGKRNGENSDLNNLKKGDKFTDYGRRNCNQKGAMEQEKSDMR